MKFNFIRSGLAKVDQAFAQILKGLQFLRFDENFESFEWSGDIDPDTEVLIVNRLPVKPRYWIVVRRRGGLVEEGETWTKDLVSLRNESSSSVSTVTVVFFA